MKKTGLLVLLSALGLTASLSATAAGPAVTRIIVVQPTDVSAYMHELNVLQSIYKKIGQSIKLRVWRATYAGPEAGSVVVAVEFPDLAALAKLSETARSNAEIGAEMKKIGGMRKIVSDSIYEEVTE